MGKKKPEAMVIAAAEVKPAVTGTDMKSIMKPKKVQQHNVFLRLIIKLQGSKKFKFHKISILFLSEDHSNSYPI